MQRSGATLGLVPDKGLLRNRGKDEERGEEKEPSISSALRSKDLSMSELSFRSSSPSSSTSRSDSKSDTQANGKSFPLDYSEDCDVDDRWPGSTPSERTLLLMRQLASLEQHERSLQINPTKKRRGQRCMTPQQRDVLEWRREHALSVAAALERERDRATSSVQCTNTRVVTMVGEQTTKKPTFIADKAETWTSRERLLSRFLSCVNKYVVRDRVSKRLAAVSAHAAAMRRQRTKGAEEQAKAETAAARTRPLLLPPEEELDGHVQRDFLMHTFNVQAPGYRRGHDSVSRNPIHVPPVPTPKLHVAFDDIIPFDANVLDYPIIPAPVVPTYVHEDWLSRIRSGAWEESLVRAPTGESRNATSADAKPLRVDAHIPNTTQPAMLTSPMHKSATLLDVETQSSTAVRKTTKSSSAATPAPTSSSAPSASSSSPPSNTNSNTTPARPTTTLPPAIAPTLNMPEQFLSAHPIAQQHSMTSSSTISISLDPASSSFIHHSSNQPLLHRPLRTVGVGGRQRGYFFEPPSDAHLSDSDEDGNAQQTSQASRTLRQRNTATGGQQKDRSMQLTKTALSKGMKR